MKTKLVLWGQDKEDKKVLITLELKASDNKIIGHVFPESVVSEEFENKLFSDWRHNREVEFPEGFTSFERSLSLSENLLPDDLKVERTDVVNTAKTEWAVYVLSQKLYQAYKSELEDIKEEIEKVSDFKDEQWNKMKEFWAKVQEQVYSKSLFREHSQKLKETTNEVFSILKELRTKRDGMFAEESKERHADFMAKLNEIEESIEKNLRLQPVFDKLRSLQESYFKTKFTKEHRNQIWSRLDGAFKVVKERMYGNKAYNGGSSLTRLEKRMEGLEKAIDKMQNSINRDNNEISFQENRKNNSLGQLEEQLKDAKLQMLKERVNSKSEKLLDMKNTMTSLQEKLKKENERAEQRKKKQEEEKHKIEIKNQIAEKIKAEAEAKLKSEEDHLKAAADLLKTEKEPSESKTKQEAKVDESKNEKKDDNPIADMVENVMDKAEDTIENVIDAAEDVIEKVEDVIEDAVDTAKAIASVIKDKISEK